MRKLIALLTAISMIFAVMPVAGAEITNVAQATYRIGNIEVSNGRLTPGDVLATVLIIAPEANRRYLVSLGYYDGGGKLVDFSAKSVTSNVTAGYNMATGIVSMNIPSGLEDMASVRVIVIDAITLEPMEVSNSTLTYHASEPELTPAYDGIYERYYTLDGADGSIAVVQEGRLKYLRVAETGTPFRLKDMGDGWVGFADEKYRLYNSDGTPGRGIYGFGSTAMLWKLIPEGEQYYIKNYDDKYLAIDSGEVLLRDEPCLFTLTKTGETPFTLVTAVEGYKLLTEAQKRRLTEICTSPGAVILPSGTNATSLLETMEAAFTKIYDNREAMTPEEQKSAILAAMATTVTYNSAGTNEINGVKLDNLPGCADRITQTDPVIEHVEYIWDIGEGDYNRIDATYHSGDTSQTVKFYYNESGKTNVQNAIEALGWFPSEYRQFIQQVNVYVPSSSYSYNCDGKVLTVRVADNTDVKSMARNFAHELGHSMDFLASGGAYEQAETHWCNSEEWQSTIKADILPVSKYGSSNNDEGLAEFARLYFQSYGNRDRMEGVKTLYPNRYASFNNLLKKAGMEPLF